MTRHGEADTMTERTPDPMLDLEDPPGFTELRDAYRDLLASHDTLLSDNKRLTDEIEQARAYATRLAVSVGARCFPEVPEWRPLPDLLGVLTQLDNMTCGMARAALSGISTGRDEKIEMLREALRSLFFSVFIDGRNEHGSHVLPMPGARIGCEEIASLECELRDSSSSAFAETIVSSAEAVGHEAGHCVVTLWRFNRDPEGGIEWEFVGLSPILTEMMWGTADEQRTALSGISTGGEDVVPIHADTASEASSVRSPKQPDLRLTIEVTREGKAWFIRSATFPHVHTFGYSLDEALHRWSAGVTQLYCYLAGQVQAGKEPTEQYLHYSQVIGFGARSDEPASDPVDLKTPPPLAERD